MKCAPAILHAPSMACAPVPFKTALPFYLTPEHRAWRALVIARAGGRCQGSDCGHEGVRLFADHIVEIRDGGVRLDPANGQALCGSCHGLKTAAERRRRLGS